MELLHSNKMGKRDLEEAQPANGTITGSISEPQSKKHKKEKNKSDQPASDEPTLDLKKQRKAEKKAAKAAKEEKLADTPGEEEQVEESAEAKAAAKAERKAAKQAKKEAAAASQQDADNTIKPNGHDTPTLKSNGHVNGSAIPERKSNGTGYTEDPALSSTSQAEIDAFVTEHFISVTDPDKSSTPYRPIVSFKYLPITDPAQRAPFADYKQPTPIQAAAWPYLLAGRDVIGVAETGSGKTMAFGVPCIRHIMSITEKKRKDSIKACIVSPTRELALQIHEQLTKLATPAGLKAACVYGGVNKDAQRETLRGASIIVATPGRLNDYIEEGSIDLSQVRFVVLDEADRMLDKGFEMEIRKIINTTSTKKRQTLMFTATWPTEVRDLAATFMTSAVKIAIGDNPTGELRANTKIVQEVEVIDPYAKNDRLVSLLKQYQSGKNSKERILIFCLYKKEATRIEGFIRSKGFNVAGIHGDLSQQQRTASLDAFKSGKTPLLVATDVAARGLDIPAVKLVINVTFPLTVEDYVHRIGR